MNKKYYFILSFLVLLGTLFLFYMSANHIVDGSGDNNVEENKNYLAEELQQASATGDKNKIAKVEKEIVAQFPKKLKALYELASNTNTLIEFNGVVVDQNNRPVNNASLKYTSSGLHQLTDAESGVVKTDKSGRFKIITMGYHLYGNPIRDALNQQLVLGRDDFKNKIEEMTQRQTRPKPLGRHRIEEEGTGYYFI